MKCAAKLALVILVAALEAFSAGESAATGSAAQVSAVAVTVGDLNRSVAFFTDVLEFRRISEVEVAGPEYEHLEGVFGIRMRVATLALGDERLILAQFLTPRGKPFPFDSRANDRWFQHIAIVVSDMDRAYARLLEYRVEYASTAPQTLPRWNPNASGVRAFYFRDPDGHFLELIQFPPGKGNPKWQRANGRLFLGIDHTAIVVANTKASLTFYQTLGFHVVGTSENYGTEQEHLNNVFGAHLHITSLRAHDGPGLELLEYLTPRDGRPIPIDLRPTDLAWWQIVLLSGNGNARSSTVGSSTAFADDSKPELKPVSLPGNELGFARALIISDPDGHHVELTSHE
jgi:catechol 2,3-dioxygenase-like lactoylglutathione lyase family enzyme